MDRKPFDPAQDCLDSLPPGKLTEEQERRYMDLVRQHHGRGVADLSWDETDNAVPPVKRKFRNIPKAPPTTTAETTKRIEDGYRFLGSLAADVDAPTILGGFAYIAVGWL